MCGAGLRLCYVFDYNLGTYYAGRKAATHLSYFLFRAAFQNDSQKKKKVKCETFLCTLFAISMKFFLQLSRQHALKIFRHFIKKPPPRAK